MAVIWRVGKRRQKGGGELSSLSTTAKRWRWDKKESIGLLLRLHSLSATAAAVDAELFPELCANTVFVLPWSAVVVLSVEPCLPCGLWMVFALYEAMCE